MNKIIPILFKILAIKLLLLLSFVFLLLPFAPGVGSNIVAWLETDGSWSALLIGTLFIIFTTCRIISTCNLFSHGRLTVHRGIFHTSIQEGVFTQLVQKLWSDYFHRSDLFVQTSLKRNSLYIKGEIPFETSNIDELSSFLAQELLKSTGFFGKITIESHVRKGSKEPMVQ